MSWRLHHVNVPSPNLPVSIEFYTEVLKMNLVEFDSAEKDVRGNFKTEDVVLASEDGETDWPQVHLQVPNPNCARDNGWHINPIAAAHTAYHVDDLEAVKERLRLRGVYFADAGPWALRGYDQIYLHDPGMNVIEINAFRK
jgi:catechol 2,3-dioxygenase-like lactoylglutathione lyase family enzyme